MKKILYVIGGLDRGGAESYLMNYLRKINHKKYQFVIATFMKPTSGDKYAYEDELVKMGVKIVRLRDTRFKKPWDFTKQIEDLVRSEKIDIIHSQIDFMSALTLPGAKRGGATKLISHSHNTYNSEFDSPIKNMASKILRKRLLKYAKVRLACGEDAGKYLYGSHAKFTVIPNGIDVAKFKFDASVRKTIRTKYKIPENAVVLLNVGRLEKQKNQSFLLDIFKQYLSVNSNSYLFIIGEGSLHDSLLQKINDYKLGEKVFLLIPLPNVRDYYLAADYFLLPSLYEGVPFVGIEAQASGLKCLFSDGTPEEAKILPTTEFIPLDAQKWINSITKPNSAKQRLDFNNIEAMEKYNINNSVKILEEIYDAD